MYNLFKQIGTKIEASENLYLSLQEEGKVFYLEKGSMILFASQKGGRRTFLSTVQSGRFLFTIEKAKEAPYEIFAFGEERVILWEMDKKKLTLSLRKSALFQADFSFFLEHWLNQFTHFLFSPMEISPEQWVRERGGFFVQKGEVFSLKINEVPSEKERIFWMLPRKGACKLLGLYEYKFSKERLLFPLLSHLYFLSLEKGDYRIKSTLEVVQEDLWEKGLFEFHRFVGYYLVQKRQFLDQAELKRFEEKEMLQGEMLHQTLLEMAFLLEPKESRDISFSNHPLSQAMKVVLKAHGLDLQIPKKWEEGDLKDQIAKLAEKSGARARRILLGPSWWSLDSGPLLAFYGKQRHPVALIKNQWGNYVLVDPAKKTKQKMTAKVAHLIDKDGFTFYPSLPDQVNKGKEALQFFLKSNQREFWKLAVYGLVAGLFSLFPPIAMSFIFSWAIPNANMALLFQITLGLAAAAISSSIFIYFRSLILGRIDGKLSASLQPALWDRLLKLPANFFRRFTAGDLLQRVMAMEQMRPLLTSNIAQAILTGAFGVLYVIVMAIYSIKLTLIGLAVLIVAIGMACACARWKIRIQQKVYEMQGKINGALIQILTGVSKLRVAGAENNAFSYWAKEFSRSKSLEMRAQNIQNVVVAVMGIFPLLSLIIIFSVVIQMEKGNELSIGAFLAFNSAFMTLSIAIFRLSNIIMEAAPIVSFWKRSHVIVEEPQEILLKKGHCGKLTGDVRLDHISFRYEEEGDLVLNDVSIRVKPREMIGIVGQSGSGKSTLIRMLLGFERPFSGAIYYNNKDLSHLNTNEVRKQMGVVLQGGGIIAGTLYQNLVAGGCYSEKEIERAICLASFKQDLENFPMGLHTVVPMNGETLSGGQKQRLLIARALLPNPKILIFDEATSALDNRSQEEISQNIDQLDITRIVIAHRLSTVKNADRIYVLANGKIAQEGSFEKLSNESGLFAEMLKRQQL